MIMPPPMREYGWGGIVKNFWYGSYRDSYSPSSKIKILRIIGFSVKVLGLILPFILNVIILELSVRRILFIDWDSLERWLDKNDVSSSDETDDDDEVPLGRR